MGITISHTEYAPLAFTSAIIGFVSFAFTLGTFFKVLWVNFETLGEAPHEVHGYLTNLRQELLEERESLRIMRKHYRKHTRSMRQTGSSSRMVNSMELDDVTLKTMSDVLKHLIRKFETIERSFLEPGELGIRDLTKHRKRRRHDGSVSPYYEHSAYASPPEKGVRPRDRSRTRDRERDRLPRYTNDNHTSFADPAQEESDEDGEKYWAQRIDYANYSFKRRLIWLYKKPDAQQLMDNLERVQIRRMARQVGCISIMLHDYGGEGMQTREMVQRIDERVGRVIGVRRVEGDGG
ncbi:hypothetical protein EJ03DRAFT_77564 [Teratosphaeria nubilosa]|uniref:Uncharacterized protein n=1 Tax=Teratosphaeria nubilosa TaxID=161662 RepID=A0A6G1LBD4_9PEZI|nr:hypothetical protein EJ03DRAFT_77564 [Teratosphaeria nubilosa]